MAYVEFDTVYAFGDSYSDIGAGSRLLTNGGTAVSYLAEALGNPMVLPTANNIGSRSIDFAESSAKVWAQSGAGASPLREQVDDLLDLHASGEITFQSDDTLFFLAGGLNDDGTSTQSVLNSYRGQVADLVAIGAQYIQIAILPTGIPRYSDTAERLNPAYASLVAELDATYGDVSISLSNWGGYFDAILDDPGRYGITNATDPYVDSRGRVIGTGSPDDYFYYYANHPSDRAHEIAGGMLAQETSRIEKLPPLPPPAAPELLVSGDEWTLSAFAQQNGGGFSVSQNGLKLNQTTNAWTAATPVSGGITVTQNTILKFDFFSDDKGEMHGIEFDNNGVATSNRGFQVYGFDSDFYNQDFHTYTGGTKTYEIPVGQYFTGSFDRLVFFSDHDFGNTSASSFSNVALYEGTVPPPPSAQKLLVSGAQWDLSPFAQQNGGTFSIGSNGLSLAQTTNAWTGAAPEAGGIAVTANTILSFDFASNDKGEMHGIEFDNDGTATGNRGFQVYGFQTGFYNQDFNTYSGGTKHYDIPVGQYFTGNFDELVFFSDHDRNKSSASVFSNVSLHEGSGPTQPPPTGTDTLLVSGEEWSLSPFAQQNGGTFSTGSNGLSLAQTTNAWTGARPGAGKIAVTEDTVLKFDFASNDKGEMHGIEFDNDGTATGNRGFQVYGFQTAFYNQDFNTYSGGTKTYEIAVGEYFTGNFDELVFFSDHDRNKSSASVFSNVELYELMA